MKTMPIQLDAEVAWEPGQHSGTLSMIVVSGTVTDPTTGDTLGTVGVTAGAGLEVHIQSSEPGTLGYIYHLAPGDVWAAVSDAHEQRLRAIAGEE